VCRWITTHNVSAGGWLLTVRYIGMKQDEKVYRRALAHKPINTHITTTVLWLLTFTVGKIVERSELIKYHSIENKQVLHASVSDLTVGGACIGFSATNFSTREARYRVIPLYC